MSQRVLFFDGVCNLCNGWVDFLLRRPGLGADLKMSSLQSAYAQKVVPQEYLADGNRALTTVVLGEWSSKRSSGAPTRGTGASGAADTVAEFYTESDAVLRVLTSLGGFWVIFNWAFWIPRSIRNGIYRWIAQRRYEIFGRRESCRVPTAGERERFLE